jgi:2-dehydropantoate 2-reductase
MYPDAEVLDGCVYIVAQVVEPGVIRKDGAIEKLLFGSQTVDPSRLEEVYAIFKSAGIHVTYSQNIESDIWEKFVFISPLASITSYADLPIGAVRTNGAYNVTLLLLVNDIKLLAEAKGISLPENIIDLTMKKIASLPDEATSSMHRDYQKGKQTEYRSLTEYVVENGKKLGIKTPAFDTILDEFKWRESTGVSTVKTH